MRIAAVPSPSINSEGCVVGWKEDGSILSTDPCIQNAIYDQTDIVLVSKYNGRTLCLKADGMVAGGSSVSGMRDIVSMCTGISFPGKKRQQPQNKLDSIDKKQNACGI